jgi:hypothetical protein
MSHDEAQQQIAIAILNHKVEPNPAGKPKFTLIVEAQAAYRASLLEPNGVRVIETRDWRTGVDGDDEATIDKAMRYVMVRALASAMIATKALDPVEICAQWLLAKGMATFTKKPKGHPAHRAKQELPAERRIQLPGGHG